MTASDLDHENYKVEFARLQNLPKATLGRKYYRIARLQLEDRTRGMRRTKILKAMWYLILSFFSKQY